MEKIKMVKTVGGIIVSVGVGAIVSNAIKCTTPGSLGTIKRVCVGVGAFVLGAMACDAATDYAGKQIDSVVNHVKNMGKKEELEG